MGYRLACPARQARRLFVLDKKTGHMNVLLILEGRQQKRMPRKGTSPAGVRESYGLNSI